MTSVRYPITAFCVAATLAFASISSAAAATSSKKKPSAAHIEAQEKKAAAERVRLVRDANILEERILVGTTLYTDARLNAYLQSIADKLSATQPSVFQQPFRVRVRSSAEPMADTLLNGAIFISYGLLGRLENESQLALILGSEMSRCAQNAESKEAVEARSRSLRNLFPNLLLITATAGLGAMAIPDWDEKARSGYARELEIEADKLSVTMLLTAGYSATEASKAFSRLADTQKSEGRHYAGRFSNANILATRGAAVTADIVSRTTAGAEAVAHSVAPSNESFRKYQRTLSLIIADEDVRSFNASAARSVLDRYEHEFGADGRSQYMRGESVRRSSTGAADDQSAIDAYVDATRRDDVPADAFKQLGFLYRKQGKTAEAKAAFREYLKRQPNAVDAPIIATFIE